MSNWFTRFCMEISIMSRDIKRMMIGSIQEAISGFKDVFVVDVSRVSALSVNRIRLDLADRGIRLLCVKNAIASRALMDFGLGCVSQAFSGASALVFGDGDIVSISKVLMQCTVVDKSFSIRSGIVDGRLLSTVDVDILSKTPGRSELLSQLSACMLSPSREIASVLSSYCSVIVAQIDRFSVAK